MKKIIFMLFTVALVTSCGNMKKSNGSDSSAADNKDVASGGNPKNFSERYFDSLMAIPALNKQASDIAQMYSPCKIVKENGQYFLECISMGDNVLKKYPMDTLLARKGDLYLYDDYDKFKTSGDLFLSDCYVDPNDQQVDIGSLDVNVDLKNTPGKVIFKNNTAGKTLKHAVFTVKIIEDKDTIATEQVQLDTQVPPKSVKSVDFILNKVSQKIFKGNSMVFTYTYKLDDYTLE